MFCLKGHLGITENDSQILDIARRHLLSSLPDGRDFWMDQKHWSQAVSP